MKQVMVGAALAVAALGASVGGAQAQAMVPGAAFAITCDNGGNYVLQSRPVLEPGQIVTAELFLRPHHPVPVRLIPMGNGYRYAGRGVWLDGIGDHALLYLRKYDPAICVVKSI